jgi:hypothetical protein
MVSERVVWSPDNGGCLMVQRRVTGGEWHNFGSSDEGEFPTYNRDAKRAVRLANAYRKAAEFNRRAALLEEQAAILRWRAASVVTAATTPRKKRAPWERGHQAGGSRPVEDRAHEAES